MDNKKEIVAYKNELNTIPLRNFNATEIDLLFSILSLMRDRGKDEVTFDFEELQELSDYKRSTPRFKEDLEKTYDKLISLNVRLENEGEVIKFVFFTEYRISKKNQTITIATNPRFAPLINQLKNNFTRFELQEMVELRSSYSKSAYRLLKQYRRTGFYKVDIDEFRRLMDIPESYKMNNIRQRVFTPIMEELPEYFKGLTFEEIKGKGRQKRVTVGLIFRFEPEIDLKTDERGKSYVTYRNRDGQYKNVYAEDMGGELIDKTFDFPECQKQIRVDRVKRKDFERQREQEQKFLRDNQIGLDI